MDIPWRTALLVIAGAFVVFLIAKMLPVGRSGIASSPELTAAKIRAKEAASPRERAAALCDAGEAALALPFGATRAVAYFLRAMRVDPAWPGSIERAASALAKRRARMLEKLLWRRLAATPWDQDHRAAVRALVTALGSVSRQLRGHKGHAQVLERVSAGEALRVTTP
jgi:hypothetical protein